MSETGTPDRESLFERAADWVSAAMGRPANIIAWLALIVAWTAAGPYLARHPFLPAWSVSTGWNFPLNLITTVAELFIGFLVAAAANRSERNLKATLARISQQEDQIAEMESKLTEAVAENTALTQAIHELTTSIHGWTARMSGNLGTPGSIHGPATGPGTLSTPRS